MPRILVFPERTSILNGQRLMVSLSESACYGARS